MSLFEAFITGSLEPYPPFNIILLDENKWCMEFALAGFKKSDVKVVLNNNVLTISGSKEKQEDVHYIHKGISGKSFERRFTLVNHIKVTGATMEEGILKLTFERELPEELKPKVIDIS